VIGHLDDVAMLAVSCAMVVFLGLRCLNSSRLSLAS
jgi:hypothetical protein